MLIDIAKDCFLSLTRCHEDFIYGDGIGLKFIQYIVYLSSDISFTIGWACAQTASDVISKYVRNINFNLQLSDYTT